MTVGPSVLAALWISTSSLPLVMLEMLSAARYVTSRSQQGCQVEHERKRVHLESLVIDNVCFQGMHVLQSHNRLTQVC